MNSQSEFNQLRLISDDLADYEKAKKIVKNDVFESIEFNGQKIENLEVQHISRLEVNYDISTKKDIVLAKFTVINR